MVSNVSCISAVPCDVQQLTDVQELTREELLLDSVNMTLSDAQCNVRSGCEDVTFHYDVLTLDIMVDVVSLDKWVTRQLAHRHLFCYAL